MVSALGCAAIAGIEKREKEEAPDDGFTLTDAETQVRTDPLCVEYCDDVMANCEGDFAVYATRETCLNTCNALPAGDAAEPFGNTVECRLLRAKAAASAPGEECVAAGPGGGQTCGTNCESWCLLLENECPDDYAGLTDCEASCASIVDTKGFSIDANYSGDTIQCRLIHLGAVGTEKQTSEHCGHARYLPENTCVDDDAPPSCDAYCDAAMANCKDEFAVYDSRSDCMSACAVMDLGTSADVSENTVGCRTYHARASSGDPAKHCDHASAAGDGHCGAYDPTTSSFTGNCESYCTLLSASCDMLFTTAGFTSVEDCAEQCTTDFAGNGAETDSSYTADTARNEDSLQCRIYYGVKAAAEDPLACLKAAPGGTCD